MSGSSDALVNRTDLLKANKIAVHIFVRFERTGAQDAREDAEICMPGTASERDVLTERASSLSDIGNNARGEIR